MSFGLVDPTDFVALVLMAFLSMHRLEIKSTDPRAFPNVRAADFERWRTMALRAKKIGIAACLAKFVTNAAWFFGFRTRVPQVALTVVGFTIFAAWVVAMTYSWWLTTSAKTLSQQLGIIAGRRAVAESGK
jgi:hypothetical protein